MDKFQQYDIENQYVEIKLPTRPLDIFRLGLGLRNYFQNTPSPKPSQADIENQLKAAKLAESPHIKIMHKYFTDPNEPWNKC